MQTSFMHPPFGFALFYLRSVAPASVKTTDIYWGAIPFVCIQIIMVALIIIFGADRHAEIRLRHPGLRDASGHAGKRGSAG
jgi:TRAP-type mannitol/chloroaromatic compound transport system permease large subunit